MNRIFDTVRRDEPVNFIASSGVTHRDLSNNAIKTITLSRRSASKIEITQKNDENFENSGEVVGGGGFEKMKIRSKIPNSGDVNNVKKSQKISVNRIFEADRRDKPVNFISSSSASERDLSNNTIKTITLSRRTGPKIQITLKNRKFKKCQKFSNSCF